MGLVATDHLVPAEPASGATSGRPGLGAVGHADDLGGGPWSVLAPGGERAGGEELRRLEALSDTTPEEWRRRETLRAEADLPPKIGDDAKLPPRVLDLELFDSAEALEAARDGDRPPSDWLDARPQVAAASGVGSPGDGDPRCILPPPARQSPCVPPGRPTRRGPNPAMRSPTMRARSRAALAALTLALPLAPRAVGDDPLQPEPEPWVALHVLRLKPGQARLAEVALPYKFANFRRGHASGRDSLALELLPAAAGGARSAKATPAATEDGHRYRIAPGLQAEWSKDGPGVEFRADRDTKAGVFDVRFSYWSFGCGEFRGGFRVIVEDR